MVAHYDSSRADLLSREPFANYRALINKLFPVAMVLPAAVAILRLLPLPAALKAVLWVIAILFSLIPLLRSVAFLFDRFAMPYTTGAICNKSSVAACWALWTRLRRRLVPMSSLRMFHLRSIWIR